tara:strand:+ start:323 stop:484 length:162 start_codon:yes stop_codon:yes gene_type:complete
MSSVTRRAEFAMYPKYEFIKSYSMRRSVATNYLKKIETPILTEIKVHSREWNF